MKNIFMILLLISMFESLSATSLKYECGRYVKGDYKGYTFIISKNRSEAEKKAYLKFKNELKKEVDYVKCK